MTGWANRPAVAYDRSYWPHGVYGCSLVCRSVGRLLPIRHERVALVLRRVAGPLMLLALVGLLADVFGW